MSETIATYNFKPIKTGATHKGGTIRIYVNGSLFDFSGATVTIHVRAVKDSPVILETLSTAGTSPVLTVSGTSLVMGKRVITLAAGKYVYDMRIVESGTDIDFYVEGTLTVLQAVTR